MSEKNNDGPPSRRRRLEPASFLGLARGDARKARVVAWSVGASLESEVTSFGEWLSPRALEQKLEDEAVRCLEGVVRVTRLAQASGTKVAGGPAVVAVVEGTTVEALCATLAAKSWVAAVDGVESALARSYSERLFHHDDDDDDNDVPGACFVEHVGGGRVLAAVCRSDRDADRLRRKYDQAARLLRGFDLRWLFALTNIASLDAADLWLEAKYLRGEAVDDDEKKKDGRGRRGDETSLELCSKPLYASATTGVLVPERGGFIESNDQAILSLGSACRFWLSEESERQTSSTNLAPKKKKKSKAKAWPSFPTFETTARAVVGFVDGLTSASRSNDGVVTCDALRKQSQLNTYQTGSFVDDNGYFKRLDRKLVDSLKRDLRREEADEGSGKKKKPAAASSGPPTFPPPTTTALALAEASSSEPAPKKRRGGAVLKLVETSRPKTEFGPPPPRTADEQHHAAALHCARLELAEEGKGESSSDLHHSKVAAKSLLAAALPTQALLEVRARQLLGAVLSRSHRCRGRDVLQQSVDDEVHGYSTLDRRVLASQAPAGAAPMRTLGATTPLVGRATDGTRTRNDGRSLTTRAAEAKGAGDVAMRAGDLPSAIAHYTRGLADDDDDRNPILLVDRAAASSRAGLSHAALRDATEALARAPTWPAAVKRLAATLRAAKDGLAAEVLLEYAGLVDPGLGRDLLDIRARVSNYDDQTTQGDDGATRGDTFDAAKRRGDAAFKAKRHDDALGAYTAAVLAAAADPAANDDPDRRRAYAAAFSNRAAAATALGAHLDAIADGQAAALLAPDWVKGHVRVATALRALSLPHDAVEAYFNALRLLPGDLDLNAGLCDAVDELRRQRC